MAVTAEKFVHLRWIRLEGELRNRCSALRALPVAFEHFPLKSAIAIVIESHFAISLFVPFV